LIKTNRNSANLGKSQKVPNGEKFIGGDSGQQLGIGGSRKTKLGRRTKNTEKQKRKTSSK